MSGPSGAGKGTLIQRLLPVLPWVGTAISATTRPMRPGEVDGEHYHFLSEEEFVRLIEAGAFLEHVHYAGRRYGTLRSELDRLRAQGRCPLVEIELQGARAIRAELAGSFAVFIAPPSVEALRARLEDRGTDDAEVIEERMRISAGELAARDEFDAVIVNDDVEAAARELADALAAACGREGAGHG